MSVADTGLVVHVKRISVNTLILKGRCVCLLLHLDMPHDLGKPIVESVDPT